MKQISENDRSYLAEHVRVTRGTPTCNGRNTFVSRAEHVRVTVSQNRLLYIKNRECYIKLIPIIVI